MAIKAILFDLDGTLLPIDTDGFIGAYLQDISNYIAEYYDPKLFVKEILDSIGKVIHSTDATTTNQQVFEQDFFGKIGNEEVLRPVIQRYYDEEFQKLEKYVASHGFIPELIQAAKEKGYRLTVATNPLFPKSAIIQRVKWAGANPEDFEIITSYENSHFAKPKPEFYQEILGWLDLNPSECLMVGNDAQEDLMAQKLGMKTYLVTDFLIDRGEPLFTPDGKGTLREFYHELLEGKGVFAN